MDRFCPKPDKFALFPDFRIYNRIFTDDWSLKPYGQTIWNGRYSRHREP
jgi:hypothetical protein